MTIKINDPYYGGASDWVDGNILYAADLVGTFDQLGTNAKGMAQATLYSASAAYASLAFGSADDEYISSLESAYNTPVGNIIPVNGYSPYIHTTNTFATFASTNGLIYSISESGSSASFISKTHSPGFTSTKAYTLFSYTILEQYDTFPGSSIDATKWTSSGTVSVTGGYVSLGVNGYIQSNGSSGMDIKGDYMIAFTCQRGGATGSPQVGVRISDGSTTIAIGIQTFGDAGTKTVILQVDQTNDRARLKLDATAWSTWVDLSSITASANWYLRLYGPTAGGSDPSQVNFVLTSVGASQASTLTFQASADDGSNYDTLTTDVFNPITNTGTAVKTKITFTTSGNESVIIDRFLTLFLP